MHPLLSHQESTPSGASEEDNTLPKASGEDSTLSEASEEDNMLSKGSEEDNTLSEASEEDNMLSEGSEGSEEDNTLSEASGEDNTCSEGSEEDSTHSETSGEDSTLSQESEAEESVGQPLYPADEIDDDPAIFFEAVISQLQRDEIAPVVQSLHQQLFPGESPIDVEILDPIYGSFNVLFPIRFAGRKRWLLKIPSHGVKDHWNELAAQALVAEATTMRALKADTTIPVPQVFDFSPTTDNTLGCPYMLIEYIDGVPLYEVWFANRAQGLDDLVVHRRRTTALKGIASAMSQLSIYSSTKTGSPIFDSSFKLTDVSALRFMDRQSMVNRLFDDQDDGTEPIYLPIEPFSNPRQYYTFPLGLHKKKENWVFEEPFVFAHPDFDIQNFIVNEEGELQAIIDWDGVCTVPRSIGNLSLPGWLTRDWDPAMYGYQESMEEGKKPIGVWENSPEELSRYRQIYRCFMTGIPEGQAEKDKADLTSMSLIMENLCIAGREPICRAEIVEKMIEEICKKVPGEFSCSAVSLEVDIEDDDVEASVLATLRAGFEAMLRDSHTL
ncbi:hypothetical protein NLG97_g3766 [Lecanicillium saksenae]|uniref:Uncharacterized protein n=1 Tax=Lecanicillium saksenae TaxID=468837 RepID=A0ACC1QZV2_9HYPO|nr:hypothetical protein NLG97_g3766 [Lecanicillium saksenae]